MIQIAGVHFLHVALICTTASFASFSRKLLLSAFRPLLTLVLASLCSSWDLAVLAFVRLLLNVAFLLLLFSIFFIESAEIHSLRLYFLKLCRHPAGVERLGPWGKCDLPLFLFGWVFQEHGVVSKMDLNAIVEGLISQNFLTEHIPTSL